MPAKTIEYAQLYPAPYNVGTNRSCATQSLLGKTVTRNVSRHDRATTGRLEHPVQTCARRRLFDSASVDARKTNTGKSKRHQSSCKQCARKSCMIQGLFTQRESSYNNDNILTGYQRVWSAVPALIIIMPRPVADGLARGRLSQTAGPSKILQNYGTRVPARDPAAWRSPKKHVSPNFAHWPQAVETFSVKRMFESFSCSVRPLYKAWNYGRRRRQWPCESSHRCKGSRGIASSFSCHPLPLCKCLRDWPKANARSRIEAICSAQVLRLCLPIP